ncbi:MAG: hypothetical protein PUD63_06180 [Clostridia bacterium]|nr:hypothetical protein [Clostridia bacterium]
MKFKFSRKGKYIILPKQFAHHGFEVEDCTVSEGGTSNIRAYFSYVTELETIAAYSITSHRMPQGGTALFAFLAMAGDLGGALGPSLVGNITQIADNDLRTGLRVGCLFPICLIVGLIIMKRLSGKKAN